MGKISESRVNFERFGEMARGIHDRLFIGVVLDDGNVGEFLDMMILILC